MKKILYWLPRLVTILFAIIPVGSAIVDSFRYGFYLVPFIGFIGLSAVGALFAWIAWKWPKIGGVILTLIGIMIFIGASNTSIGVDFRAVITGGVPITITGILFLIEGFSKKPEVK